MYDCIIPIGCSHMYGAEHQSTNNLTNPSKDTWVDLIGRHMDLPVYNCSAPGASNQTILRRLQLAIDYCKRRNLNPLFILQWSQYHRYETIAECAYNVCEDFPYIRPYLEIFNSSSNTEVTSWSHNFYKLFDDSSLFYETTRVIEHANLLTQNFSVINCLAHSWKDKPVFKSQFVEGDRRKDQIVFEALDDIYNDLNCNVSLKLKKYNVRGYDCPTTTANLHLMWENIEKNNWWHWDEEPYTTGLKHWCEERNLELGPKKHPLESANKIAFEFAMKNKSFTNMIGI